MMDSKLSIDNVAREHFFRQVEMIQFLLAENLALKTLLHEKGILKPEEFQKYKQLAEATLKAKVEEHIEKWKTANPEAVRRLEAMEKLSALNTDPNDPHSVF